MRSLYLTRHHPLVSSKLGCMRVFSFVFILFFHAPSLLFAPLIRSHGTSNTRSLILKNEKKKKRFLFFPSRLFPFLH